MMLDPGIFLATGMYAGLLPVASGVYGTVVGVAMHSLCRNIQPLPYLLLAALMFAAGCYGAGYAETIFAEKDASAIVIDEVFGVFLALTVLPRFRCAWLLGMVVFLLFDGLKPFPAAWFDAELGGGLGIMLDDMVAGVYTMVVLQLAKLGYERWHPRQKGNDN